YRQYGSFRRIYRRLTTENAICPGTFEGIWLCGRHPAATFGTKTARADAILHVSDPLAIAGTFLANLCAFAANLDMVRRADQHEVSWRPANFRAGNHQRKMLLLDMGSTHFKAVSHRHGCAGRIAREARIDTILHFRTQV